MKEKQSEILHSPPLQELLLLLWLVGYICPLFLGRIEVKERRGRKEAKTFLSLISSKKHCCIAFMRFLVLGKICWLIRFTARQMLFVGRDQGKLEEISISIIPRHLFWKMIPCIHFIFNKQLVSSFELIFLIQFWRIGGYQGRFISFKKVKLW